MKQMFARRMHPLRARSTALIERGPESGHPPGLLVKDDSLGNTCRAAPAGAALFHAARAPDHHVLSLCPAATRAASADPLPIPATCPKFPHL